MKALQDMLATQRLGDAKPGSCMTCKSAQVPAVMARLGTEQFYATPVRQLVEQHGIQYSITCSECHDAQTMALTITRPAFKEAMASRGIDVSEATRQEMRTYVCAQCHVERNCVDCHESTIAKTFLAAGEGQPRCTQCHRGTGHAP